MADVRTNIVYPPTHATFLVTVVDHGSVTDIGELDVDLPRVPANLSFAMVDEPTLGQCLRKRLVSHFSHSIPDYTIGSWGRHTMRNTSTSAGKMLWIVDVMTRYRESPMSALSRLIADWKFWLAPGGESAFEIGMIVAEPRAIRGDGNG